MKVVAIKDMAAGNDNIGEMWQETKIFEATDPIQKILDWAMDAHDTYTRKRVIITVPKE